MLQEVLSFNLRRTHHNSVNTFDKDITFRNTGFYWGTFNFGKNVGGGGGGGGGSYFWGHLRNWLLFWSPCTSTL